jgi:hypothetical protein
LEFPIERDPGVVYLEDRLGGRYRDDPKDIEEYESVADRLLALALKTGHRCRRSGRRGRS